MKKILLILLILSTLLLSGCLDTELGHSHKDHDHDGDGIQDHEEHEYGNEEHLDENFDEHKE